MVSNGFAESYHTNCHSVLHRSITVGFQGAQAELCLHHVVHISSQTCRWWQWNHLFLLVQLLQLLGAVQSALLQGPWPGGHVGMEPHLKDSGGGPCCWEEAAEGFLSQHGQVVVVAQNSDGQNSP